MGATIAAGAISIIPPVNPVTSVSTDSDAAGVVNYTAPIGRTFYCTGLTLSTTESGVTSYGIEVGGVEVMQLQAEQYLLYTLAGQPIFAATSGQTVAITSSIARSVRLNIWGFYI